jgi:hypothetical protein
VTCRARHSEIDLPRGLGLADARDGRKGHGDGEPRGSRDVTMTRNAVWRSPRLSAAD